MTFISHAVGFSIELPEGWRADRTFHPGLPGTVFFSHRREPTWRLAICPSVIADELRDRDARGAAIADELAAAGYDRTSSSKATVGDEGNAIAVEYGATGSLVGIILSSVRDGLEYRFSFGTGLTPALRDEAAELARRFVFPTADQARAASGVLPMLARGRASGLPGAAKSPRGPGGLADILGNLRAPVPRRK